MTAQHLTDCQAYNAMRALPTKHRPSIDTATRNILERLLIDLMRIRDFEFDAIGNRNEYTDMDVCNSILARLIDRPVSDNVTH